MSAATSTTSRAFQSGFRKPHRIRSCRKLGDHCNMTNFQGILNGSTGYAFKRLSTMESRGSFCGSVETPQTGAPLTTHSATFSTTSAADPRKGIIATCTHPEPGKRLRHVSTFSTTPIRHPVASSPAMARPLLEARSIYANNHIIGRSTRYVKIAEVHLHRSRQRTVPMRREPDRVAQLKSVRRIQSIRRHSGSLC